MQLSEFKTWARRELGQDGDCGVNVELTENQLTQALEKAKDWFNTHVGLHKEASFSLVEGISEYDLSAVTPRVDDVMEIWFPRSGMIIDFSMLYPGFLDVEGFPYREASFFGKPYPQTTIVQTLQNLESLGRLLNVELDFEFYRDDFDENTPVRKLRIMPLPKVNGMCIYLYRVDPRDIKLRMYKPRDLYMIREWAIAEAKIMLARIRGKYPGGVQAAGAERQLDADTLLAEAREDKDRLRQEIRDHDGPVRPVIG